MIDVLASMAVIMLLIAILLPSLSLVRETARRVVCGSNIRQVGLGLAMYADDYGGLPPSRFNTPAENAVHQSTLVRALVPATATGNSVWDGLGLLYQFDYIVAPGVFYCPSHHGDHPFTRYAPHWPASGTEIFTNFQFRVSGPSELFGRDSGQALIADALRTQADFNHAVGCNFVRRDLSATWYSDSMGHLIAGLPASDSDGGAAQQVRDAWEFLDGIDVNGDPR